MAKSKIIEGMESALDYAKVERAVLDWIREDAPTAAKMTLQPEHVARLVDRIVSSKTTVVNVKR